MSAISLPLPAPPELTAVSFFLLIVVGYVTRVFTKNLDEDIQKGEWFKGLSKIQKILVKKTLDLFHHWPLGWALMVWSNQIAGLGLLAFLSLTPGDVYWIGAAIFIDDLPDVPRRVQDAFKNFSIFGQLTENTTTPLETPAKPPA